MSLRQLTPAWCAVLLLLALVCPPDVARAQAQGDPVLDGKAFERLEWRSIGPANMGGRTADVEGIPGNPNLVYVATASGGLWKTTNGGVTWRPIFERQGTISIGDIAIDPTNQDVIWVGAGESNTRNSVSFGDGVYKSLDGGQTWQHMGLRDSERISRIVVNPRNPEVVHIGALGHAFGPNEERGVFMTIDGGKTWTKTLYVDNQHGVADLDIDPVNPNILYAAVWRFERKPWTHTSGSEKGGVFKSIDGGRTWNKLTNGLPKMIGRIGVKVAPSNPNVVYAITEAKEGTLYRSDDRGETFRQVSNQASIVSRGFYYTDLRVDPTNENRVYAVASTLFVSIDGGRTFRSITGRTHIDYHALWIDPLQPRRMWQGQDGGVAVSTDAGETWEYVNNMPLGQFYQIHADNRQPFYHLVGGLQDNGTWTGPSRTREPAGILNDDWRMVSFGDGFYALNHADDPDLYLTESQGGNIVRTDMRTREQQLVIPALSAGGPASGLKFRFNWNAPFALSPHDKNTVFLGGNVVFKTTDFGKSWQQISPDLTTDDKEKQKDGGGPVAIENTGAEYHTTLISLAESPLKAGVIWAGTDDGNLQLTTDGGKNWTNLIKNVSGLASNSPVSHVEPSRTNVAVAYASFDRHMLDDFRPYVFKTTDGGQSWMNISGDLPAKAYVWVVREDPKNTNLIYAGTELGLYASYDGGRKWIELNLKNLPRVAIHDILIHPRENDLILATHGRSIWILDDATAIQQATPALLNSDLHLFDVRPALRFATRFTRYGIGDKVFTGPNPPYGALVTYYLKEKPTDKTPLKIQIFDDKGKLVTDVLRPSSEKGLNRVAWDLRYGGAQVRRPPTVEETANFGGGPRGPQVVPGSYTVRLTLGDKTQEKKMEVRLDPQVSVPASDLQITHDMSLKLRDMQSAANTSLRTLDSLKEQLQFVEKTIKDRLPDAPKDLLEKLTATTKQVDALQNNLARPQQSGLGVAGGRAQLADRIGGLFFSIEGVNAAPTPAQREYFTEIQTEFRQRIVEVNKFTNESVPQLNDALRRANAPTVIAGKSIDVPQE